MAETEAGTGRQELKHRPWRDAVDWLAPWFIQLDFL